MINFIKTKNKIYKVEDLFVEDGVVKGYYIGETNLIRSDQVLQWSEDTVDCLCDKFVIELPNKFGTGVHLEFNFLDDTIKKAKQFDKPYTIYGAMYVIGKGLIYMAKYEEGKGLILL